VMSTAYRGAQGAEPYGDKIHASRQMLINHEIGHRLGYGHVTCDKDGELAPVMQQQTKSVDHDGIDCRPNPWPYPNAWHAARPGRTQPRDSTSQADRF